MTDSQPGEKRRFLLELWLEPRAAVSQLFRIRGRMRDLDSEDDCSVAGIGDIEGFIRASFAAPDRDVRWETET